MKRVILASGSPRRKDLLTLIGVEFDVVESGFNESLVDTDDPHELVEELSLQKALAVSRREFVFDDFVIIGADTVVFIDDQILGKPETKDDAEVMIRLLSGATHTVLTGIAVIDGVTREQEVASEKSLVTFRDITEQELRTYVDSDSWQGFAGGYAIQQAGRQFVVETQGAYSNIIGLPFVLTRDLLEGKGVPIGADVEELDLRLKGDDL